MHLLIEVSGWDTTGWVTIDPGGYCWDTSSWGTQRLLHAACWGGGNASSVTRAGGEPDNGHKLQLWDTKCSRGTPNAAAGHQMQQRDTNCSHGALMQGL